MWQFDKNTVSVRLFTLVVLELARKYTRFLILGFFAGLLLSLLFWRIYPLVSRSVLFENSIERIGMVGEFTPSNLPLSIQRLVSLGLTKISPDGTPVPALALSWEATNSGKTFIFTLRDDFTWHTGKKVTAHDVNYNIRGVTFISTGDTTLIAYLQYPYSPLPTLLSKPVFLPGLNGIGLYSVGRIQLRGENVKSITLVPVNDLTRKQKQYTFYQTEAQAQLAFQLGEVDELVEISTSSALQNWGRITVSPEIKFDRIVTLFFNLKDAHFSNKNVRQGLALGIPELRMEKANSPLSKTSWAYTKNVKSYQYNPEEAKRMLKSTQLGSASSELVLSTFPTYLEIAQRIAASWTALGIPTKVQIESTVPANYQVLLSAQDVPPDPDQYPFWHSTQSTTNITGYTNVKIDKLLEDGRQEIDPEKRKAIYTDFQRRLVEDAPAIFLYYPKLYSIRRGK